LPRRSSILRRGRHPEERSDEGSVGFADLPICRLEDLPICRLDDLPICRFADLPICRFADLPIYQFKIILTLLQIKKPDYEKIFVIAPAGYPACLQCTAETG
jgi:hypothetical protein